MTTTEKQKLTNNPLYFSNSRTEALEEALLMFVDALEEYAEKNELTEEQVSDLKQLILDSYTEKRASYFVEEKFSSLNDYLKKAFHLALKRSFSQFEKEDITRILYYNYKDRLISNEQY